MKLILTEKPSVAEDFAKALEAKKNRGYYQAGEFIITWAFGHLYEIDDSEFLGERWSIDKLPFFPANFKLRVILKAENYIKNHAKTIKDLVKDANEVIIAGDAGREGELIAREILVMSGWQNWKDKTFRFWSSESLTKDVIIKELKSLKPAIDYDSLYFSGLARQHGDWICGINLTRYTTCKVNSGTVWTAGRVQSPTLNLIVERDLLIKEFKPQEYWIVKAEFEKNSISFNGNYVHEMAITDPVTDDHFEEEILETRLDKDKAELIVKDVSSCKTATVEIIEKKLNKIHPPLLFSITELQKEANRLFGYSLDETLKYAQTLYETHKVLSYPRSDSTHLGNEAYDLVIDILKKLAPNLVQKVNKSEKRIFDSNKLTDHHAIIVLDILPSAASEAERNIYTLVLNRFCAAFMDDYLFETTKFFLQAANHWFKVIGNLDISLGWKARYKDAEEAKTDVLPLLEKRELVRVGKVENEQKFTKPPSHYNDRLLVSDMKKYGLGTAATRPDILKRLILSQYVVREKNKLLATEKGFEFIKLYHGSDIISVSYIAQLEQALEDIYEKKKSYQDALSYVEQIKTFVSNQIETLKGKEISEGKTFRMASAKQIEYAKNLAKQLGDKSFDKNNHDLDYIKKYIESKKDLKVERKSGCSCGGILKISSKTYSCSCGKIVWLDCHGKKLNEKQALSLLSGEIIVVKGMKSQKGGVFNAKVRLKDTTGKVELIFDK